MPARRMLLRLHGSNEIYINEPRAFHVFPFLDLCILRLLVSALRPMIWSMKIYTRTGDDGTTGLIGGSRVLKSDPRIEAYGTVDELNAVIGCAAAVAKSPLLEHLRRVQGELFVIGSHLATPSVSAKQSSLPPIEADMIRALETEIDQAEAILPPLKSFILPGGGEFAARLHVARTVCRRAERLIVGWSIEHPNRTLIIEYLNRLSDWLFVQARGANHRDGIADIPWINRW